MVELITSVGMMEKLVVILMLLQELASRYKIINIILLYNPSFHEDAQTFSIKTLFSVL